MLNSKQAYLVYKLD